MLDIIKDLQLRGILKDVSDCEKILSALKNNDSVYCGFDPSSSSLHIGNLIQLFTLKRFSNYGFKPIILIGGSTGLIGDPSGKENERQLISKALLNANILNITKEVKKILPNAKVLNNLDWIKDINVIDFLRDIGKEFNISYLINKEHIRSRIDKGLSFTEFSYNLLQAYDFYYLYQNYNVKVQIGGSDQWGNIISGIDFIKSKIGNFNSKAAGLTIDLLLKSDGKKFGKTETGTIWLSPLKTNPYDFFQFFLNQDDKIVKKLLNYFTFLSIDQINDLEKQHKKAPYKRIMQNQLASILTRKIHGFQTLNEVKKLSKALFSNNLKNINLNTLKMAFNSIPNFKIKLDSNFLQNLLENKICSSKREANELISNGTISINGEIQKDKNYIFNKSLALNDNYFLIRKGKKNYFLFYFK